MGTWDCLALGEKEITLKVTATTTKISEASYARTSLQACEVEGGSPTLKSFFYLNVDADPDLEIAVSRGWDATHQAADCKAHDEFRCGHQDHCLDDKNPLGLYYLAMNDQSSLIESLLNLSEFLEQYGLTSYSQKYLWVAQTLNTNPKSVQLDDFFESAYISGGMGAINDVIICAANGNPVSRDQEDQINEQFRLLLEKVKFELKYRNNRMSSDKP